MASTNNDLSTPLTAAGVDFSNETQASIFLQNLMEDRDLQISANAVTRKF